MDDAEPLIQALLDPAAYPHDVVTPVGHIQTHISHVLLTGKFAYKIKKPVDLGFLDYSTLERRKHFCFREIELNKEFSPELYLDVAPIYSVGRTVTFVKPDAPAEIVEYAAKMRQFREEDVLLRLFERGELRHGDMVELARRLAELHTGAKTSSTIAAFGEPDNVRKIAQGNIDRVREFVGITVSESDFDEIASRAQAFLADRGDDFERRVSAGCVRECHGDLHLNNICRFEGRFHLFDRIEFNDEFKNIDVMYDLAFLLMDLQFRGRFDFANVLLNEYLELSGDFDGGVLLPFYVGMRALIRGLVQSIFAGQAHIEPGARSSAESEACQYFKNACRSLAPRPPRLILVGGVSGSGKSHFAARLAPVLGAIRVRSDAVRKHLAGVGLHARGADIYSAENSDATYGELNRIGITLAATTGPVILDATFIDRARRARVMEEARGRGIPASIVFCTAPLHELRHRLDNRTSDISDASVEVMDDQRARVQTPDPGEAELVRIVDTSCADEIDSVIDAIRSFAGSGDD